MVDLSDVPGLSAFAGIGTLLVDLIVSGGDLIMWLVFALLSSVELWLPFISTLNRLAGRVEWIPEDAVSTAMTVVLIVIAVVYIGRIGSSIMSARDTNDN